MVSKKTHLNPVDLVQIGNKENTKKQKKSTTKAPPSGHRCLLHPLPPNEEKQVHSKNLSLWNTFGTTSLILLVLTPPLSLFSSFLLLSIDLFCFFFLPSFFLSSCSLSHFLFSFFFSFFLSSPLSSFFYHSPVISFLPFFLSFSLLYYYFSSFFLFFLFYYFCPFSHCSCLSLPLSPLIFFYTCSDALFQTLFNLSFLYSVIFRYFRKFKNVLKRNTNQCE